MTFYSQESVAVRPAREREHHWDAIRAVLMLLGIPYHVALAYQGGSEQSWIVNAHQGMTGLATIAEFIHLFRMPAFFIIAGYFAALLLVRRSPDQWLAGRVKRLGIPFVAALVLLNPIVNYACELSNFPPGEAWRSLLNNSAKSAGYWIRHLWFLIVLLYFCAAAAGASVLFPELRRFFLSRRRDAWLARHFALTLAALAVVVGLWEAVSIELFWKAGLAKNVPQQLLRIDDALQYAPYFLIGLVVARTSALRERVYRFSPGMLVAGVVLTVAALTYGKSLWPPYERFLTTIAGIALTQPMIALMRRLAHRPSPLVREFVSASFVIYLFHLPILVWLVVAFTGVAMPVGAKAVAIAVLTLGLSYGAWQVVRQSPLLRLLFDGVTPPKKQAPARPMFQSTQSSPMSR
jgi:glucan biosynthesis protein C